MKMTVSVGRCLERKTMLVWVKEYIKKNFVTCKSLSNLQELYKNYILQRKHPDVNIGFSKFCTLRPEWCVLAGWLTNELHCVCSAHQNVVLLVDLMYWDLTYKYLIKKIVCNPNSNKCMIHWRESCPGTAILKEFLDQELKEHEDDEEFNYC